MTSKVIPFLASILYILIVGINMILCTSKHTLQYAEQIEHLRTHSQHFRNDIELKFLLSLLNKGFKLVGILRRNINSVLFLHLVHYCKTMTDLQCIMLPLQRYVTGDVCILLSQPCLQ